MLYDGYVAKTVKRYHESIKKHGGDVRGLDWHSKASQLTRFSEVVKILGEKGISKMNILDVGCGFGDLFDFLLGEHRHLDFNYVGVDITPDAIKIAKKKHKGVKNCDFHVGSLFNLPKDKHDNLKFDYIFMVDILDTLVADNERILKGMLKKAFDVCNHGVVMSCLSTYADWSMQATDEQYYVEPEKLFKIARQISPWIDMKHSHLPHNVIVYLYKKQQRKVWND